MLTPYLVTLGLGFIGWMLWLLARRDLAMAGEETREAHARSRLAEGKASAVRALEGAERDARAAAEAQVRSASAEIAALRFELARTLADRDALADQLEALGADRSEELIRSTAGRLRLYGRGSGVRNRDDG